MYSQLNKKYFVYINPISIATRNPTIGFELKLKNTIFDAIQFEGAYMFQDKSIGGFLYKGYKTERSTITKFESFPINRIPFFVYNGATYRIAGLKYLYGKSTNQYLSFSVATKLLSYDSLEVNYSNTPKIKRESFFVQTGYYTHTRIQNEKLKAIGIGLEYGLRSAIDNIIINFFVRANLFYVKRNIISFDEKYNYYFGNNPAQSISDNNVYNNNFNIIQFRTEIGIRIGLTNF